MIKPNLARNFPAQGGPSEINLVYFVTSSIPDYFRNSEKSIICYRYENKPIRTIIFNFNNLVSDS